MSRYYAAIRIEIEIKSTFLLKTAVYCGKEVREKKLSLLPGFVIPLILIIFAP